MLWRFDALILWCFHAVLYVKCTSENVKPALEEEPWEWMHLTLSTITSSPSSLSSSSLSSSSLSSFSPPMAWLLIWNNTFQLSIIWTRNQGRSDLSASSKEKPCRKKHTMFENWLFWTKEFFVDLWLGLGVMGWYGRLWDQSILVHWHPYWNEIKENSLCVTDFISIVYKIISTSKP